MALIALLPFLLAAAQAAPASAHFDERRFGTEWSVQASDAPLGVRTFAKHDFVLRQRLLPPSLIRLKADAADAKTGRVLAPAGAQLFGLATYGPPIFCAVGGGRRYACFIDMNRDGALDGHFLAASLTDDLPNIYGKRSRSPDGVRGGAYDRLDPKELVADYYVGLIYAGNVRSGRDQGEPVFAVMFGNGGNGRSLSDDVRPVEGSDPALVRALGAELVVRQRQGETIEIDLRRAIPPQQFGVVQG
jgi:hypothetical protein